MMPAETPARSTAVRSSARAAVDGKFFRVGDEKFYLKGITYGPFKPSRDGELFPSSDQTHADFRLIGELGANLLRVYHVPPPRFLDLASEHNLKLLIDIPWPRQLCFLDSPGVQLDAIRSTRESVKACKGHSAV